MNQEQLENVCELCAERMEDIYELLDKYKAQINIKKAMGLSYDPECDELDVEEGMCSYYIKDTAPDVCLDYNFVLDANGGIVLYLPAGTDPVKFLQELNDVINHGMEE